MNDIETLKFIIKYKIIYTAIKYNQAHFHSYASTFGRRCITFEFLPSSESLLSKSTVKKRKIIKIIQINDTGIKRFDV